jgi:hypothetical protein
MAADELGSFGRAPNLALLFVQAVSLPVVARLMPLAHDSTITFMVLFS